MADDSHSLKDKQDSYFSDKEQNYKEDIDSQNKQEYSKNSSFNYPEIIFEKLNKEINLAKENSKDLTISYTSNSNSRINEQQQLYIEQYLDSKYWSASKNDNKELNDSHENLKYINGPKSKLKQNNTNNKIPKPYLSTYSKTEKKKINIFEGDISNNNNKSTYGNDDSENDENNKNENEESEIIINNEDEEFDNIKNENSSNNDYNNYDIKNIEEKNNTNKESDINKIKSIKININKLNNDNSQNNNHMTNNQSNSMNKEKLIPPAITYDQNNYYNSNNCSKINPFFYTGFSGKNNIGTFAPSYNNYISTSNYLINNINKNMKNLDEKKVIENNNTPIYFNDYYYKTQSNNNDILNFNNINNNLAFNDNNNNNINFINPSMNMNMLFYNAMKKNQQNQLQLMYQQSQTQNRDQNNLKNMNININNKFINNNCFHKYSYDNTNYLNKNNKNTEIEKNERNEAKNKNISNGNNNNNNCNSKNNNNNTEKHDNNNNYQNSNNFNKGEKNNNIGTGKGEKEVLNLDNIISGKDTRTTVMIRNIPIKYSDEQLKEALDEFKGKYNCLYMPFDFEKNGNKGYAFINFVNPLHILYFYEKFNGRKWMYYESSKICELNVAHFQGINEIKKHAKNYKGMKKPTFYIGDNYQKEINNNMIIPSKYLAKLKQRFPRMNYTENKSKKIIIVKSFSNN